MSLWEMFVVIVLKCLFGIGSAVVIGISLILVLIIITSVSTFARSFIKGVKKEKDDE